MMKVWQYFQQKGINVGRILRFGITGGLSTLLHYAVYYVMLTWVNPTLSYTIGYGVGFCFNYVLTTFFTFRQQPTKKNAAGFLGSHVVNYLLEIAVLNGFIWLGINKQLSGIITLIVVVPINYLILRFVFTHGKRPE